MLAGCILFAGCGSSRERTKKESGSLKPDAEVNTEGNAIDPRGLPLQYDEEKNDLKYYRISRDEDSPLSLTIVGDDVLRQIASVVYITNRMSVLRGGISDINSICPVSELRKLEIPDHDLATYYCIYGNKRGGRLYVFFRGSETLFSSPLAIYSEKRLTPRDFDGVRKGVSTFEDVKAIDPGINSGIIENEMFEGDGTYNENIYQTFHMVESGYIVVDYKSTDEILIVNDITFHREKCIQGINIQDWPS
jgi:hypothetical protein